MGCVDTKFLEVLDRGRAKEIASNARHHEHVCATKAGRNRLVRALASESEVEFLAEDRFTGLWELIGEGGQVDVGASDHRDARASGHKVRQRTLRRPSLFGALNCVNGDSVAPGRQVLLR